MLELTIAIASNYIFCKQLTRLLLPQRALDNHRVSVEPCKVVISRKIFALGEEEETMECELQGVDLVGDESYRMVDVQGLPDNWAMLNGIVSGVSTIFAPGSRIDDGMNALVIRKSTYVEVVVSRLDTHGYTKEVMMD